MSRRRDVAASSLFAPYQALPVLPWVGGGGEGETHMRSLESGCSTPPPPPPPPPPPISVASFVRLVAVTTAAIFHHHIVSHTATTSSSSISTPCDPEWRRKDQGWKRNVMSAWRPNSGPTVRADP